MDWETRTRALLTAVYPPDDVDDHMEAIADGVVSMLDAVMSVREWELTRANSDVIISTYVKSYVALHPPAHNQSGAP